MATADLILKFELVPGRSPDADNATLALSAWVDLLRATVAALEPDTEVRIELVGVEKGSQTFLFGMRKIGQFGADVLDGMSEFPLVKKAVIALGGLITSTTIVVGVTNALTPDPRIPDDQMVVFEETRDLLKQSVELQQEQMRFFGALQNEPAYDRIDVLNDERALVYSVPRDQFAARSGLWLDEAEPFKPIVEFRKATWDVVLIKPVLIPEPRRWRFAREGLEFSALMQDPEVLEAIHNRTLPVQVAEGVMMKVEVNYKELYDGKVWIPVAGSHKIKRVLHPLSPVSLGPLFSPDAPQKNN